ncbi:hypothetical protein V4E32_000237 [Klebsiella pneumoniae]|nr:hypothetical protein [Klebsiella pneumoniae]EKZ6842105.1 hypothetical protein [Klebsiella pneumoniae]HBS2437483.1 hypothetical protein [Klebsiella pneumoniae]
MAHVIVKFRDRPVDVLTHSPRESTIGITANDFDLMITGGTDFAKVMGQAFITRDGEALEGEELDDVVVLGIVPFVINRTSRNDDECPVI